MNIGIIVYSQTGNTLSVAQRLQEKLTAAGHSATIEQIEVVGEIAPGQAVQFKTTPDPTPYDALVIGGPVQAFSLNQATKEYLKQCESLEGKPMACLVTQAFPFAWMGGNRALRQMAAEGGGNGGSLVGNGYVVNWMRKQREAQIEEPTDEDRERQLARQAYTNFGFEKVERLPGNIGYLKFNQFSDTEHAMRTAVSAMHFLENCDAVIIDLRENGGGSPSMIQLISTYFLEEPTI